MEVKDEAAVLRGLSGDRNIARTPDMSYRFPARPSQLSSRPVVIGAGPCGLFAGLILAQMGFRPIILERGKVVRERTKDTWGLWRRSVLNPESNVQFGEGGAGTFSDGKLHSGIKDPHHRDRKVLTEFVKAGAPPEILFVAKPHIGTFRLVTMVESLRASIEALGGEYRFQSKVVDIDIADDGTRRMRGVVLESGERIAADHVVLAVGHSARDTFQMLHDRGVAIEAKPFSIGVRIEHPQSLIDRLPVRRQCRQRDPRRRRLQARASRQQRPLGLQLLHVSRRHGRGGSVRAGRRRHQRHEPVFAQRAQRQRRHRRRHHARRLSGPSARRHSLPAPLGASRVRGRRRHICRAGAAGRRLPRRPPVHVAWQVVPSYKPGVRPADLGACLPDFAAAAIREALPAFDRQIKGFAMHDAVMTGVETRTSSPIRIRRDDSLQSLNTRGLYPAGEGAGYAGGILSAGVDGIRVAEAVALDIPAQMIRHSI